MGNLNNIIEDSEYHDFCTCENCESLNIPDYNQYPDIEDDTCFICGKLINHDKNCLNK